MNRTTPALAAALLALAGCSTAQAGGDQVATAPPSGECDAAPGQALVGQQASAETGQRLLALSGARTLRWAPPDSAMTMDFRPDRLTVSYDPQMRIERVTCG